MHIEHSESDENMDVLERDLASKNIVWLQMIIMSCCCEVLALWMQILKGCVMIMVTWKECISLYPFIW